MGKGASGREKGRQAAGRGIVSGETAERESGWTIDTLHESLQMQIDRMATLQQLADLRAMLDERYQTQTKALDAAFKAAEQAVQTALVSAEKAVVKAEAATDKRFESVNEFRQQLNDQAVTFMPRAEAEARLLALAEKFDVVTSRLDTSAGRSTGVSSTMATMFVVGALVVSIIAAFIGHNFQ